MSEIIEFLIKIFLGLIVFVVLFPIIWVLATPFILCGSLLAGGDYGSNVKKGYKAVSNKWIEWGAWIIA